MTARGKMAGAAAMMVMGLGLGFLSSFVAGCESDRSGSSYGCDCSSARVGTTTLGEPTTDDSDFPSLEGAWLNVRSLEVAPYDAEDPAAVLEYYDSGDLVRVKFAAREPTIDDGDGGAGGAAKTTP